jgi:peptidoglycan/xylan/chitin deacetylase (PgdA/CDA1 family)
MRVLDLRSALTSPAAKKALYVSGALDVWHRRRNRDRLTVIMFHRVLSPRDRRWPVSDPEYTLSDDLFGQCLDFFRKHYNIVALSDLLAARAGQRALPDRALLVTFDDGWSDNEEFALPHLKRTGIPALMFVAGSAIGRDAPFWQEQLVHAWRAGRLDAARATRVWRDSSDAEPASARGAGRAADDPPAFGGRDDLDGLRALIARLEQLEASHRTRVLAGLADVVADGIRHMITPDQLKALAAARVAIGAHGFTHDPLTRVDATAELSQVRAALAAIVDPAPALSFPHGKFDTATVERARGAGFPMLFTSVPELPPGEGRGPGVFGRVGFTGETITEKGRFAPEKLALHLFRKPHAPA